MELSDPLVSELNALKQLDVIAPSILHTNPDTIAVYFGASPAKHFITLILILPQWFRLILMSPKGRGF